MSRIAIFSSRTGSDALHIAEWYKDQHTFRFFTNNPNSPLLNNSEGIQTELLPYRPTLEDYQKIYYVLKYAKCVLLMGYLRVIPAEMCEKFRIFNLHPGLITEYPELKGADPQKRALELGHPNVGCVIHEVVPEIDAGKILMARYTPVNPEDDLNKIYYKLGLLAKNMWMDFLENSV